MELQQFLEENTQLKFLKWTEIIVQENLAAKTDAMYIVPKDLIWCDVIFVDSNGNKRKIGGSSYEQILEKFALLDGSNLTEENIENWKDILGSLSATIEIGLVESLEPDEEATVTNVGTNNEAIFNFGIPKGEKGENGEISVINFQVNDEFHLIMDLQTNTNLNFMLDNNGHLILTN